MAKFFVSYARIDSTIAEEIIDTLRQRYGHANVWYDQELHNRGGENWWEEIRDAVGNADIFIYLLSKESVESPYCQAEFEEAQRLKKRLIFIQIRDKTPLPPAIASRQYTDMSKNINDLKIWTALYNSIDYQISQIPARKPRPLNPKRTPRPQHAESSQVRPVDVSETTPALKIPQPVQSLPEIPWWKKPEFIIGAVLIPLIAAVITILPSFLNSIDETPTLLPTTALAQSITDEATQTLSNSPTPTASATATEPAPELPIALIVGTLDAQATVDQQTANAEATIAKRATDYAQATQDRLDETATATLWTHTSTPNMTASIEAYRTEQAATTTQAWIDSWTATPTPTATFTPSNTPTATFTSTPNATATLIAFRPRTNADWTPIERDFDGVTMVLVPAGCFMMGSTIYDNEQPVHEQCFDAHFWIDKTEVTQSQFQRLGGVKANDNRFAGADRPVELITWFEARDFCALRDARLPTEREWEYAARGPDNLLYPWGNEFIANNVVYSGNSNNGTAVVGSRPAGTSWVGALDMSGNVWEWTSSLYASYPYDVTDGREADTGNRTDVLHILRGGSWFNSSDILRAPIRNWYNSANWNYIDGFRCARSYE